MTGSAHVTGSTTADLIRRWQRGWGECRGWAPAEEARGALHLLLRLPGRCREVVALHADDDPASVAALAAEVAADPEPAWLTVPTTRPDEVERVVSEAGLRSAGAREWFMTRDLTGHPAPEAVDPYRCTTATSGRVVTAEVWHGADLAARGNVAVVDGDAVADRVETRADHRRRGLGGVVVGALAAEAAARGATTGLLVASTAGERLYASLGWSTRAAVVIATNGV
ncbi:GNAT family N-acetyltransferase [Saccharothrix syringae]|uniref:GNAT family N-acetyltransferase n=1 Tax=Saccharothrix syringae TaxID=103733 RepID=A0A5Q0H0J3_SACSY|nr:GNAT family N-acetyltransferase [Saccharothrix syringae]QFZ19757.1 GNAT family N-acetyltransferase [Saccharothrix syringae]